jgi:hypothetical protein
MAYQEKKIPDRISSGIAARVRKNSFLKYFYVLINFF